ncbi:translesion DNA synthesis-associated protein ImuA [Vibrio zhugei]|uniref:Translesion DNA synthesis-associated protein ImuA n=1 Tax=Vibrio zhugei TaxID=2479546 RepID=A0ABV7CCA4_9VIBR|nr:translesion DNA synthesis-associated protein ImuA [Vibrio zhugei]
MNELITELKNKHWLWQGTLASCHGVSETTKHTTGYPVLDQKLMGGFPHSGVVELQSPVGIGELRLLLPYLAQKQQRLTVFINPPSPIHSEALIYAGLTLDKVRVLTPKTPKDALWAAEQCLKSGACEQVLLWQNNLEVHHARRLQVASTTGQCVQFLLRRPQQQIFSLPVTLSLQLQPAAHGITVTIKKYKGAWPSEPFTVPYQEHWPDLIQPDTDSVVVPFQRQKQG